MSDEELRELRRRAERDPFAALELARSFERIGSPAAALEALWLGCDDLDVRRLASRIERRCAPLVTPPRVAWEQVPNPFHKVRAIQVHPLAVTIFLSGQELAVDPRSGASRFAVESWIGHRDEVLLHGTKSIRGTDAWTGEDLFATPLPDRLRHGIVGDDLVVTSFFGGETIAFRFSEPRRAPVEAWRWRSDFGPFVAGFIADGVVVLGGFEGEGPSMIVALDAALGSEKFRLEGLLARVAGGMLFVDRREELVAFSLHGEELWRRAHVALHASVVAVTESCVLVLELRGNGIRNERHLLRLDRTTGALLDERRVDFEGAFANDFLESVAFAVGSATNDSFVVGAFSEKGERLWRWQPKNAWSSYASLHFLPGRVYVTSGKRVACLVAET